MIVHTLDVVASHAMCAVHNVTGASGMPLTIRLKGPPGETFISYMSATIPVGAASNATVQVPTVPVKLMPGIAIELEATLWAERLFAAARTSGSDAARFMRGVA